MVGFPLFDLHFTLLGKVASKLEGKSYARLQQTCHGMENLVQTNRHVTACVQKDASLEWEKHNDKPYFFLIVNGDAVDLDSLHGVRFAALTFPPEIEEKFEEFCSVLKKYRVTCERLDVTFFDGRKEPPKEQCTELFKILKPDEGSMDTRRSNRFEAFGAWKGLKTANIRVAPEAVLPVLNVVSQFPEIVLKIEREDYKSCGPEQYYSVLVGIFQFLRSVALPHLRRFYCSVSCEKQLPVEEQLHRLSDFHPLPMIDGDQFGRNVYVCILGEISFELTFGRRRAHIRHDQ